MIIFVVSVILYNSAVGLDGFATIRTFQEVNSLFISLLYSVHHANNLVINNYHNLV